MDQKKVRLLVFGLLVLSIILLIVGAVLLGVGISKLNQSKVSPTNSICATDGAIHMASTTNTDWNDNYADSTSSDSQQFITTIKKDIQDATQNTTFPLAMSRAASNMLRMILADASNTSSSLQGVVIDFLQKSKLGKVNFYGTLIFDHPVGDTAQLTAAFQAKGYSVTFFRTAGATCQLDALIRPASDTYPPFGAYTECEVRDSPQSLIVMIDGSLPVDPYQSMQNKRDNIVALLNSIAPPAGSNWYSYRMGLGVYYGSNAYLLNNYLCSTTDCWNAAVSALSNTLNENQTMVHNITRGLEFVRDEFGSNTLQLANQARTVIFISDGYEYDRGQLGIIGRLERDVTQAGINLGVLLVSDARTIVTQHNSVFVHAIQNVRVPYYYHLQDVRVTQAMVSWICRATFVRVATTLPPPNDIGFTESTAAATTTGTVSTTAFPLVCNNTGILFLFDFAETLDPQLDGLKTFMRDIARRAGTLTSEFAYIGFNNDNSPIAQSGWLSAAVFDNAVQNLHFQAGDINYVTGFNALSDFLDADVDTAFRRTIIFITTGKKNLEPTIWRQCGAISNRLRQSNDFMGYAVGDLADVKTQVTNMLGGASDRIPILQGSTYASLPADESKVIASLPCTGNTNVVDVGRCGADIVFAIEYSDMVKADGVELATRTIQNYITNANTKISQFDDRVGIVVFSNRDSDDPTWPNNVTNIIQELTVSTTVVTQDLQRITRNINILGIFSDVDLGLSQAQTVFSDSGNSDNLRSVVLFSSGEYASSDPGKCCADPTLRAQSMRDQGIFIQAVPIGSTVNIDLLTTISDNLIQQSTDDSFIANALIAGNNNRKDARCPPLELLKHCTNPFDLAILVQVPTSQDDYNTLMNFIRSNLYVSFGGVEYGLEEDRLTRAGVFFITTDNFGQPGLRTITEVGEFNNFADIDAAINGINYAASPQVSRGNIRGLVNDIRDFHLSTYGRQRRFNYIVPQYVVVIAHDVTNDNTDDRLDNTIAIGSENLQFVVPNGWAMQVLLSDLSSSRASVVTANFARNQACDIYRNQQNVVQVATTTPAITHAPGPDQGDLEKSPAWPDITILIDTSADLTGASNALNDRGFEVLRLFLVNTLIKFKIGSDGTRVSLVTYDGTAKTVFTFNDIGNWDDLYYYLTVAWEYGPDGTHTADKGLTSGLNEVLNNIYQGRSGYRLDQKQYLWIFTTGAEGNNDVTYIDKLRQLSQAGINIYTVGLGSIDQTYLTSFGPNVISSSNYVDPLNGLASFRSTISGLFHEDSIRKSDIAPTLAQTAATYYFALEYTALVKDDLLNSIKLFLKNFATSLTFGPNGSNFGLITFGGLSTTPIAHGDGITLEAVLAAIDTLAADTSGATTSNYNNAIGTLSNILLNPTNLKGAVYVTFISTSNNPQQPIDALTANALKNGRTVFALLAAPDDTTDLTLWSPLASDASYVYKGAQLGAPAVNELGRKNEAYRFIVNLLDVDADYQATRRRTSGQAWDVRADIVFVIDDSAMDDTDWANTQAYLRNFTGAFPIGSLATQVAIVTTSSQFNLSSSISSDALSTGIGQLTHTAAPDDNSPISDLLDLVDQGILTRAYGFRGGAATYVFVVATNNKYAPSTNAARTITSLKNKANVIGLDMCGRQCTKSVFGSLLQVYQFTAKDFFEHAQDISADVTEGWRSPVANAAVYPIKSITQATYVFLVDFSTLTPAQLDETKNYISEFARNVVQLGATTASVGYVYYHNGAVANIRQPSTTPDDFLVNNINVNAVAVEPQTNLQGAIETASQFALRDNAFIVFIHSNSKTTTTMSDPNFLVNTLGRLRSRAQLYSYAFVPSDESLVVSLLSSIVTTEYAAERVVVANSLSTAQLTGRRGFVNFVQNYYGGIVAATPSPAPQDIHVTPFPTGSVVQDIVFIIDSTANVVALRQFISTVVNRLPIDNSPVGSLVSAVVFNNVNGAQITLSQFTNRADLLAGIGNLVANQPANAFNLTAALLYVNANLITPASGFRGGSASLVILTDGAHFADDTYNSVSSALSYMFDDVTAITTGQTPDQLTWITNKICTDGVPQVNCNQQLSEFIATTYQTHAVVNVPRSLLPVWQADLDIVLLVDHTTDIGDTPYQQLREVLGQLVAQLTIGTARSRVTLVGWNHDNVFNSSTYTDFAINSTILAERVRTLARPSAAGGTFNVKAALNWVDTNVLTGVRTYQPASIIIFTGTSTSDVSTADADHTAALDIIAVRSKASIFAVDLTSTGPITYLARLTAPTNIVSVQDVSALTIQSTPMTKLINFLSNTYLDQLRSYPVPPKSVTTSTTIIVDTTSANTQAYFTRVLSSVNNVIDQFDLVKTRLNVLFWSSQASSNPLQSTAYANAVLLKAAVRSTVWPNSTATTFDIQGALNAAGNLPNSGTPAGNSIIVFGFSKSLAAPCVQVNKPYQAELLTVSFSENGQDEWLRDCSTHGYATAPANTVIAPTSYQMDKITNTITYSAQLYADAHAPIARAPTGVNADIYVVIDTTKSYPAADFATLKGWLPTYFAQFQYTTTQAGGIQVAIIPSTRNQAVTLLTSSAAVTAAVNAVTQDPNSNTFDVNSVLQLIKASVETRNRPDPIILFLLGTEQVPTQSTDDAVLWDAYKVLATSSVGGVNFYGFKGISSLILGLNGGDENGLISPASPDDLANTGVHVKQDRVSAYLTNTVPRQSVAIGNVNADVVFILDTTQFDSANDYTQLQAWLTRVTAQATFTGNRIQFGLTGYPAGVIGADIALRSPTDFATALPTTLTFGTAARSTTWAIDQAIAYANNQLLVDAANSGTWRGLGTNTIFVLIGNAQTASVTPDTVLSMQLKTTVRYFSIALSSDAYNNYLAPIAIEPARIFKFVNADGNAITERLADTQFFNYLSQNSA